MHKALCIAGLLTLISVLPLSAAEGGSQAPQLQTFVKNMNALTLPADCCPEIKTERPIPENYAALFESEHAEWAADPLVETESISEYQYGYTLFQNADIQGVVVYKTLYENSLRYSLFELWTFDLKKGLVGRLELSGDYLSVMLSNGHATYYDLSARIFPNGQIERQLTYREEAGLGEDESLNDQKTVVKTRFQVDLKTGKIVLLK